MSNELDRLVQQSLAQSAAEQQAASQLAMLRVNLAVQCLAITKELNHKSRVSEAYKLADEVMRQGGLPVVRVKGEE